MAEKLSRPWTALAALAIAGLALAGASLLAKGDNFPPPGALDNAISQDTIQKAEERKDLPKSARPPETAASPVSLQNEREYFHEVKVALAEGDTPKALQLLDEHQMHDPKFKSEGEALRAIARCRLNPNGASIRAAMNFLRQHPKSPHRRSIERSCPLP